MVVEFCIVNDLVIGKLLVGIIDTIDKSKNED